MAAAGRILLVVAPYYDEITSELERGARLALAASGLDIEKVEVPGAFEIPAAIAAAAVGGDYAAYVALGCVIRGETSHYDHVCNECARGLMDLTLEGCAIGFGVLTVETYEQALEHARVGGRDKGAEAARAALAMMGVFARFSEALPEDLP